MLLCCRLYRRRRWGFVAYANGGGREFLMDRIRLPAGQVNRVNTHTHTATTTLIKYYKGTVNFFFCCLVVEDLQPRRGMNEGGSENFKMK